MSGINGGAIQNPATWRYSVPAGGISLATYPGNVQFDGIVFDDVSMFADVAAVEAARIPPVVTAISTAGYSAPGDGGAAYYARAGAASDGSIQSLDGQHWALQSGIGINVKQFPTLQIAVNYAAANGCVLYLGDDELTVAATVNLPDGDYSLVGPGSGALAITFTGTGGLFVGTGLDDNSAITISGFRAIAGAPDCGAVVSITYANADMPVPAVKISDVVAEFNISPVNYWTGGFYVNNARNSVFNSCYVHGPSADLSRTAFGFWVDGITTDCKFDNCQAVSVGTAIDIEGEAEGTVISNFVAVDVNIGVSKVHTGGSEPWIAMSNWHINCRQKAIYLEGVLQTTIEPGLIYCQNGVGDWIGIHVAAPAVVNQDLQLAALIDGQLAGGGVTSRTGLKIDAGNGINAKVKMRALETGVEMAAGITNTIVEIDAANDVTNPINGAGAYAATNRAIVNLPGNGWGLPKTSGAFNPDNSANPTKEVQIYGFGRDTVNTVKGAGGIRMVAQDANFVNVQTELMVRRGDAFQQGLILMGTGSPEGVVAAPVGAIYTRNDGGAGTTLYIKESGTGNTGWVAK